MAKSILIKTNDKKSVEILSEYLNYLNDKHKDKEVDYQVDIKKVFPTRSLSQNARYHAIKRIIAIETGHTDDEIDYMFKMDCWYEDVEFPDGRIQRKPRSTKDNDTVEHMDMMNRFEQWKTHNFPSVIIPDPRDLTYKTWMNINNEYDRVQSGY